MFENVRRKFKNIKIKESDLIKSFLILLYLSFLLLIFINENFIQFYSNGFRQIVDSAMQVYYLDVGQASSTMIVFPNKTTMLIDTGSLDSEEGFIESIDLILRQNKLHSVDFLVLTHSDADHVGGAVALLDKFEVSNIYRPKLASNSEYDDGNLFSYKLVETEIYKNVIDKIYQEPNCSVEYMSNFKFSLDEVDVEFMCGLKSAYDETNAYSPFITIDCFDRTFLFTGDTTEERETEFVTYYQSKDFKVDFLQISHHGSKYSSTADFLEFVSPTYAFVSAEYQNYPANEVVQRLEAVNISQIYVTRQDGMTAVGLTKNGNYFIVTMDENIDLPFFVVVFSYIIFVYYKFITSSKKVKGKNNFKKNTNILSYSTIK